MVFEGETGVDRGEGSGAASEEDEFVDGKYVDEHDGRSGKATGFDPRDAHPADREKYERLSDLNEGRYDTDKNARRRADARRAAYTYMSRFKPPIRNKERVIYLIDRLSSMKMGGAPYELTVLAVITLVANEEGRWIRDERMFNQLLIDLDGSRRSIRNLRQQIRDDVL